jgi:hypothetical protein
VDRGGDRGSWDILDGFFLLGWVDPYRLREISGFGDSLHEALGVRRVGRREDALPTVAHRGGVAEVDDGGRQEPGALW